jgi:hypothetical protein
MGIQRKFFVTKLLTLESSLLYMMVFFIMYDLVNFINILLNSIEFDNKEFIIHYSFDDSDMLDILDFHFQRFINLKKMILICLMLHLSYLALRFGVRLTRKGNSSYPPSKLWTLPFIFCACSS